MGGAGKGLMVDTVETPGFTRRPIRSPVRVVAAGLMFPGRSVPIELHNVSLAGFCATTDAFVPIGGQMILCLPGGEEFAAEIRWAFAGAFGARLVGASRRDGRRLRALLLAHDALAGGEQAA
jgi:hypothetical protein